jgi:bifunctional DNA-binding transcriptional regulator/antitoxin component of YhaV-PrlF toxin-antitoxin module
MERFLLRVASKRQVTLPARLLALLRLSEGDVLELSVDGSEITGRALKLVPSSFFSEKMLAALDNREMSLDNEEGIDINSMDQLAAKIMKS